jgi:hypothetical protein
VLHARRSKQGRRGFHGERFVAQNSQPLALAKEHRFPTWCRWTGVDAPGAQGLVLHSWFGASALASARSWSAGVDAMTGDRAAELGVRNNIKEGGTPRYDVLAEYAGYAANGKLVLLPDSSVTN